MLPETDPYRSARPVEASAQPTRPRHDGEVAVQVLTVRGEHRGAECQSDGNGVAHREHRETVIGVRAYEVTPTQGSQPPEPVRASAV